MRIRTHAHTHACASGRTCAGIGSTRMVALIRIVVADIGDHVRGAAMPVVWCGTGSGNGSGAGSGSGRAAALACACACIYAAVVAGWARQRLVTAHAQQQWLQCGRTAAYTWQWWQGRHGSSGSMQATSHLTSLYLTAPHPRRTAPHSARAALRHTAPVPVPVPVPRQ